MWIGFPVAGAAIGWVLKAIADWVASLAWAPFQGPFKLVASIAEPQATIGALAIGAVGGLVFAYLGARDSLTVTVADDRVTLARGGSARVIERAAITDVFLDGKKLVLLGADGAELAREGSDLGADRIRDALVGRGYPWRSEGDPYRDEFRRWVEDMPDLPAGADALFKARAKALSKRDNGDIADLRAELARLGLVVRDEGKRQYWRRIPGTSSG